MLDLLKPFKKAVNKVKDSVSESVQQISDQIDQKQRLQKWRTKFENAKASYKLSQFDEREYLYLGTRSVDANVNSGKKPTKDANNVYNIVYEMIESQVSTQIPQPSVQSKRPQFTSQAKMIEDSIANDLKESKIEQINDINERITPKQGFSIITVEWDQDVKHQLYKGDIRLGWKHTKQLIPQPGIFDLQKMDYFFVLSSVTKEYIKRQYGVDLAYESEMYPEVTSLSTDNDNANVRMNNLNEKVTEIVCWYKDEDGDIGRFVWVDNEILEDLPKYFYRRMNCCTKCGWENVDDEAVCPQCGGKKFAVQVIEQETLGMDTQIGTGDILPAGTQIPYFVPTRYPFSIRANVPADFAFGGQSDIDVMRDQQDSIKKVVTKLEEKLIKSNSIIALPEDLPYTLNNGEAYQVVRGGLDKLGAIRVIDLTAPIDKELEFIQEQRQVVQQMLGITNSYQGLQDSTAQSGRAKQIQVQQASGRLQSKQANKYAAYKELFEIMFEFKLAFYDELRPYLTKDKDGNDLFGDFNKYLFIMPDNQGGYYYNTDFMFSADQGSGLPKDPMFMYEQANDMVKGGVINKVQYWTLLESLHFPNATEFKQQAQAEAQQPQTPQDVPAESISYKDLPIPAKIQMLAKIGIQVTPQDFTSDPALQQAQPQQPEPIDAHSPALELTKLQLQAHMQDKNHQHELNRIEAQKQAEIQKMAVQTALKQATEQPKAVGE